MQRDTAEIALMADVGRQNLERYREANCLREPYRVLDVVRNFRRDYWDRVRPEYCFRFDFSEQRSAGLDRALNEGGCSIAMIYLQPSLKRCRSN